jgi:stage II sporulation protein D
MIFKMKKLLILMFLFFNLIPLIYANQDVRILLSHKNAPITFKGSFDIKQKDEKLGSFEDGTCTFIIKNKSIYLNKKNFGSEVYLKSNSDGYFQINGYKYRGSLKLIYKNKLYLINYIDLEEYIKGVLPNEISPKWPIEVVKAQAIAARTFAYSDLMKSKGEFYDLTDNTFSQVYKGLINENLIFNKAIKQTEGEVLTYQNELVQAFFHSACGGSTESAEKVWGEKLPYLRGIPCTHCRKSPYYKWETVYTEAEILKILNRKKYGLEGIRMIRAGSRSHSGRWITVKIIGKKKSVTIKGNDFRIMVGSTKLKSTKFHATKRGNKFLIRGNGWGHGVGLCQWGAKTMAEKGYKYYQILRYYYRNAILKPLQSKYVKKD